MRPPDQKKLRRWMLLAVAILLSVSLLLGAGVLGINAWVIARGEPRFLSPEQASALDVDCILVLGCKVTQLNPSHMLEDRLKVGISLYQGGAAPKLLMSGDHGVERYNEVAIMKLYAMEAGVPSSDIFMDHAGFSTYDSIYRAKEIFGAESIVIVSQGYHLYRALYLAEQLGIEAYGVCSDLRGYTRQWTRELREILARVKDAFSGIFLPEPKYLGEAINLQGNGDVTNDADFFRISIERAQRSE